MPDIAARQFSARLDLRSSGLDGDEGIQATSEWAGLTVRQVRDAIGYYSEYPTEIDERTRGNEEGRRGGELHPLAPVMGSGFGGR